MSLQPCVIQITRRRQDNAEVPELTGRYLLHYDPRRDADNCYYLTVTDDRTEAKIFTNHDDAVHYYYQTSPLLNGHIQQPLAEEYHVEIVFLPALSS